MQKNYNAMPPQELQREYRSLHKKLIFPNILIVVIAAVAAISLILGAWLDITVPVDEKMMDTVLSSVMDQTGGESNGESGEESSEESGSESDDATSDIYALMLKNVNTEIRFTVKPLDLISAGFSSQDTAVTEFLEKMSEGLTDAMEEVAKQMIPAVFATLIVETAYETRPDDFKYADLDVTGFANTLTLLSENNPDEAKSAFLQASAAFASDQLGTELTEEDISDISEGFDTIVEQITVDGEIDFLAMFSGSSDSSMDFSSMLDKISDAQKEKIALGLKIAAIFVIVCAGLWALLALLALLHVALKNKKVAMWYVKLTGLLPFLICMGIPWLLLHVVIPRIPSLNVEVLSAVTMVFGGYTFISAICLVALWIVSIFLCHPVKKKIKRCKRALNARG